MPVERREQAIAIWIGSTGNGRNPIINGRRRPSCDGTSRMTRECHVRICERLGVKFPGPTRHYRRSGRKPEIVWCASTTGSATRTETLRRRAKRRILISILVQAFPQTSNFHQNTFRRPLLRESLPHGVGQQVERRLLIHLFECHHLWPSVDLLD
jgi:hypothetical protein